MKTFRLKVKDFLFWEEVKQHSINSFISNTAEDLSQRESAIKDQEIKNLCKEYWIPLNDILERKCNYRIIVEEKYNWECEIHLCEIKGSKRMQFNREIEIV